MKQTTSSILRGKIRHLISLSFCLAFPAVALLCASAEPGKTPAAPAFSGNILGVEVRAEHLGIVLDISESMKPALPAVRADLAAKVPRNPVVHVDGCRLEKPDPGATIQNGLASETVTAMIALAEKAEVDTVLWISDQGDPHVRDGIQFLEKILTEHELKLIVLSLKNKPSPSLRNLAEASEGSWSVVQVAK
ncbi:MAG: hypothetical protein MI807_04950 [Verrucomicrobiales bacterium]|nr:hypothetical protein [Verrucomicrobiales bacterium]